MEDNLCHYTHEVTNGTGFYMAGCTDPSWQDPSCPKQCTSEFGADIIYDTTNDQWNCCFSREGFLNCQQPSDFVVQAPAPLGIETVTWLDVAAPEAETTGIGSIESVLGTISTTSGAEATSSSSSELASTTSSATSTSNTAASASSTASAAAATISSSSGGLIVVGIIAGLAILAVGALSLYRWNKRNNAAIHNHSNNAHEIDDGRKPEIDGDKAPPSYHVQSPVGGHEGGTGYHELRVRTGKWRRWS